MSHRKSADELRRAADPALAAATYLEGEQKAPSGIAEDIKRSVQLQARLIAGLLDLTRITRGKLHLGLEDNLNVNYRRARNTYFIRH